MDYVEEKRTQSHLKLFPELVLHRSHGYAATSSKWFANLRTKLGFTITKIATIDAKRRTPSKYAQIPPIINKIKANTIATKAIIYCQKWLNITAIDQS